jgi:hypothetical protein
VKTRALLLLCGVSLALASGASADPVGPAPRLALDGLPPYRVLAIVRATGFDPMGPPARHGDVYTVRALDPGDVEYRLVIDARTGRTVSVQQIAMPGPYRPMPAFGPYDRPIYGRIFGPGGDETGSLRPPHDVPHVRPQPLPPQQSAAPRPTESAAHVVPPPSSAHAPLPRPRPYVMEATSSVPAGAPKKPELQKSPEPPPTVEAPKAEPPKDNGGAQMPPIAPLD